MSLWLLLLLLLIVSQSSQCGRGCVGVGVSYNKMLACVR